MHVPPELGGLGRTDRKQAALAQSSAPSSRICHSDLAHAAKADLTRALWLASPSVGGATETRRVMMVAGWGEGAGLFRDKLEDDTSFSSPSEDKSPMLDPSDVPADGKPATWHEGSDVRRRRWIPPSHNPVVDCTARLPDRDEAMLLADM